MPLIRKISLLCLLGQPLFASAFNFQAADIQSFHKAITAKQLSCEEIIKYYLDRIKKYNLSANAPLNAITQINPSALDQARTLDDKFKQSQKLLGPLHCIPTVLKDNIDSYDTITSSGSYALIGNQPFQDAALVEKLRSAGAIILAKGGMDEFAWGMFGISSRSGRIGNAYNFAENPGGSSSGIGVAVAANFALIGIGSDNSGSVRIPAAFNGVVGLRPSMGLVSQHGIFPMGNLDGIAGPIARNINDLALVFSVISNESYKNNVISYLPDMKGRTIAVVRKIGDINTFRNMPPEIEQLYQQALQKFRKLGATLIEIELPQYDNNRSDNESGELQDVDNYLKSFPATRKNFRDICLSERTRTWGSAEDCLDYIRNLAAHGSKRYQNAIKMFAQNKQYVETIMKKKNITAFLLPISTHGSATYDAMTVNTWRAPLASNAGLPGLSFNIGYDAKNMPVGLEIVGKSRDEATLMSIAYLYESTSPAKRPPILGAANDKTSSLNIPELNNLFTLIGSTSYDRYLSKASKAFDWEKLLSAQASRQIIAEAIDTIVAHHTKGHA